MNPLYIFHYLRVNYGGIISSTRDGFYVRFGDDMFHITILSNGARKCYEFSLFENGKYESKFVDRNLARGLFIIWSYTSFKETGMYPTQENWEKFKEEVYKYEQERRVK